MISVLVKRLAAAVFLAAFIVVGANKCSAQGTAPCNPGTAGTVIAPPWSVAYLSNYPAPSTTIAGLYSTVVIQAQAPCQPQTTKTVACKTQTAGICVQVLTNEESTKSVSTWKPATLTSCQIMLSEIMEARLPKVPLDSNYVVSIVIDDEKTATVTYNSPFTSGRFTRKTSLKESMITLTGLKNELDPSGLPQPADLAKIKAIINDNPSPSPSSK